MDGSPADTGLLRHMDVFSDYALQRLAWHGIRTIDDLTSYTAAEFKGLRMIGRRTFNEAEEILRNKGLRFK